MGACGHTQSWGRRLRFRAVSFWLPKQRRASRIGARESNTCGCGLNNLLLSTLLFIIDMRAHTAFNVYDTRSLLSLV